MPSCTRPASWGPWCSAGASSARRCICSPPPRSPVSFHLSRCGGYCGGEFMGMTSAHLCGVLEGFFQVADWGVRIFNWDVIFGFPHMEVATIELALCFVAAGPSPLGSCWGMGATVAGVSASCCCRSIWVTGSCRMWRRTRWKRLPVFGRPSPHLQPLRFGQYGLGTPLAWPNANNDGTAWSTYRSPSAGAC